MGAQGEERVSEKMTDKAPMQPTKLGNPLTADDCHPAGTPILHCRDLVVGYDGRPLLPAIEGGTAHGRDLVRSENYGFAMFREDRYKLVVYEDDLLAGQLFDLEHDPNEERNLIADAEAAPVLERMLEQHVRPFLATPAQRPHESLITRLRRAQR